MTLFDITVFGVSCISILSGLYRGMINIIIGFGFFVLSLIVAYLIHPISLSALSEYFTNGVIAVTSAYIISYVLSSLFFGFLNSLVLKSIKESVFVKSWFDRLLGGIIGGIKGLLYMLLTFVLVAVFSSSSYINSNKLADIFAKTKESEYPEWLKNSMTYDFFGKQMHILVNVLSALNITEIIIFETKSEVVDDVMTDVYKDL